MTQLRHHGNALLPEHLYVVSIVIASIEAPQVSMEVKLYDEDDELFYFVFCNRF